jgi:hypothetical protein
MIVPPPLLLLAALDYSTCDVVVLPDCYAARSSPLQCKLLLYWLRVRCNTDGSSQIRVDRSMELAGYGACQADTLASFILYACLLPYVLIQLFQPGNRVEPVETRLFGMKGDCSVEMQETPHMLSSRWSTPMKAKGYVFSESLNLLLLFSHGPRDWWDSLAIWWILYLNHVLFTNRPAWSIYIFQVTSPQIVRPAAKH